MIKLLDSNIWLEFRNINNIIYIIKIFFIIILTCHTNYKILNIQNVKFNKRIIYFILIFIISILCTKLRNIINFTASIIYMILFLSIIFSKLENIKLGQALIVNTISTGINYILFFLAIVISFLPNVLINIQNDYLSLLSIIIIYIILLYEIFKIKKFKYGLMFLKNNIKNDYYEILMFNISIIVLFSVLIVSSIEIENRRNIFIGLIALSIFMFITIQKSLQLYYKQELLRRNIEESKKEVENKNKELQEKDKKIEKLEKENLELNKKIHSINYRQDSLTYKLNALSQKSEIAEEIDIRDRINKISKIIEEEKIAIELTKTNIEIIDDMLRYMQSECIKNNIDFELKINGNIKHMAKNIVSKEDLEILIATLIKNAIIAINYSDNVNKSILVRLGIIDGIYSLYVYDTGIEFKIETLLNLGIKPSTTHADNGGTGMGFMNTFDTLNKYKASIIIKEYGEESKDNYTKTIIIKFDKNNNYKINSYRSDKIKEKDPKNIIVVKL